MSSVELQRRSHNRTRKTAAVLGAIGLSLGAAGISSASTSAKLSVTPRTHLKNHQKVFVSGTGFAPKTIVGASECSTAKYQPTIEVYGNKVSVSCSNPLKYIESTTSKGVLKTFGLIITRGVVGPPIGGKDSAGHIANIDAKLFPCPPTIAQEKAGATCVINAGDANGDNKSVSISF